MSIVIKKDERLIYSEDSGMIISAFNSKTNNLVIKLSQTIALVESVLKPKEDII